MCVGWLRTAVTVETHMRLSAGMPALWLLTVVALSTADGVRVGRRLRPADILRPASAEISSRSVCSNTLKQWNVVGID